MDRVHYNMPNETISFDRESEGERHFIPRNKLSTFLLGVRKEDIPWAVNFLVSQLTISDEPTQPKQKHAWEDYQLSAEIEELSSFKRESLPTDYASALTERLEEKYR